MDRLLVQLGQYLLLKGFSALVGGVAGYLLWKPGDLCRCKSGPFASGEYMPAAFRFDCPGGVEICKNFMGNTLLGTVGIVDPVNAGAIGAIIGFVASMIISSHIARDKTDQ